MTWYPTLYFLAIALWAGPASAQAPWNVEATYNVPVGKAARLSVTPNIGLKSMKVIVTDEASGAARTFKARRLSIGRPQRFSFPVPTGKSTWTATFEGRTAKETLKSTFRFEVISVGPLKVNLEKSGVDLTGGRLRIRTNQRLASATLRGFDPSGEQVLEADVDLPDQTGVVTIEFTPVEDAELRRVEIKISDPIGRWVSFRLVAWYVEIPHDDVVFATGSAEIAVAEAGKLDSVVERIKTEVQAFRKALGRQDVGLDLKLYVAGCTDTVGAPQDNLRLSRERARAIAGHFRRRGVTAPIFYEGYGESLLAVKTNDNVDESQNRRAIYVLTNTEPSAYRRAGHRWRPLN